MVIPLRRRRIANDIRRFAVRDLPQNFSVSRLIAEMVPYGGFINGSRQYSSGRIGSLGFFLGLENPRRHFRRRREES